MMRVLEALAGLLLMIFATVGMGVFVMFVTIIFDPEPGNYFRIDVPIVGTFTSGTPPNAKTRHLVRDDGPKD